MVHSIRFKRYFEHMCCTPGIRFYWDRAKYWQYCLKKVSIRLCNAMDKSLFMFICLIGISNMLAVQATPTVKTWGEVCNVRAVEEKTATARWFIFVVQHRTLRFPTVKKKHTIKITRIKIPWKIISSFLDWRVWYTDSGNSAR